MDTIRMEMNGKGSQMKKLSLCLLIGLFALISSPLSAKIWVDTTKSTNPPQVIAKKHYVVAISDSTSQKNEWMFVARKLQNKYQGTLLTYKDKDLASLLPKLREIMPNYVCIVSEPEQVGRKLIVDAHRTFRRLNDDPYTDVLWGVLTGYTAQDALRIAGYSKPLVIRRAASSMGPGILNGLQSGFASDEGNKAHFWQKTQGAKEPKLENIADFGIAERMARAFNTIPIDLFITSGHASERDWQIIYNVNAGTFRHDQGKLFSMAPNNPKRFYFKSPNPKVYIPAGNCLIGHIDRKDCMTTSWIHSGGVYQMIGYTLVTFYGYMGWGTKSYFDEADHTLAESFFATEQSLLRRLSIEYPELLKVNPTKYGMQSVVQEIVQATNGKFTQDMLGLLWDRDAVAFYGDPAWQAHYDFSKRSVDYQLEQNGKIWKLTGTFRKDHTVPATQHRPTRPFIFFFPNRLNAPQLITNGTTPKGIVLTDLFVMVPFDEVKKEGETFSFSFQTK